MQNFTQTLILTPSVKRPLKLSVKLHKKLSSISVSVRTLLTIGVSSVELNARTQDFLQQQRQYLEKSFSFYELISINHESLQDRLKDYLKQEIDASVDEVRHLRLKLGLLVARTESP